MQPLLTLCNHYYTADPMQFLLHSQPYATTSTQKYVYDQCYMAQVTSFIAQHECVQISV